MDALAVKCRPSTCAPRAQAGFSLTELMVAVALGLFVLAGLSTVFLNSSRTRDEIERANRQIENGRYAMQVLSSDLRLSGFLAEFEIAAAGLPTPAAKPDPCLLTLPDLNAALPLHLQGYDGGAALACLADVRPGTDIVVIRRASSCVRASPGCPDVPGAPYFQASLCNNATELASVAVGDQWRLDTAIGNLDRHKRNCTTISDVRQYHTHIYFVANNDAPGDGIPTLKLASLGAGGFAISPIAQGIENMHFEYGIDSDLDGVPDAFTADPDSFNGCAGPACVAHWRNAMAVKINLLARNTTPSHGDYLDNKTYVLGLKANGSQNVIAAANDKFRRHVYQSEVRLNNPAGRRDR